MATATQALGMTTAEIIAFAVLGILLLMIAVSVRVVFECVRKRYVNPLLMGALMFGSSVGSFAFMILLSARMIPRFELAGWVPIIGLIVWVLSLMLYAVVAIGKKRGEETDDRADWQRELDEGAVVPGEIHQLPDVPDVVPLDVAAAAAPGPRRAISLPAADSDQGKPSPSEQTIKRMSVAEIKQAESAPKPPRAGEVPGNPILPEGEVKIRCLACDKKMKADSAKFLKQRRCPSCKAEPFRYVTAV